MHTGAGDDVHRVCTGKDLEVGHRLVLRYDAEGQSMHDYKSVLLMVDVGELLNYKLC